MDMFGKEPVAQAISTLVHDTAHGLCNLDAIANLLEAWLEKHKGEAYATDIIRYARWVRESKVSIQKDIDALYVKAKNDFK